MASNILRMVITEEDLLSEHKTRVPQARMVVRGAGYESLRSERERERLLGIAMACNFSDMVVLENVDARAGEFAPPTGFAALVNAEATLRWDVLDRHLFRGLASVQLAFPPETRLEEGDLRAFLDALDGKVRDRAPRAPLLFHAEHGGRGDWEASLGSFAWMGVYESGDGEALHLAVVSGLDEQTWEELAERVRRDSGKVSLREAWKAYLGVYRDLAKENRARLLRLCLEALGEALRSEAPPTPLPGSDIDVFVDDLREYQVRGTEATHFVRLAGCASAYGHGSKLVRLRGPLDPIALFSSSGPLAPSATFASQLHAYAAQVAPAGLVPTATAPRRPIISWDHRDRLGSNVLAMTDFPALSIAEPDAGVWRKHLAFPLAVRVSCRDRDERVRRDVAENEALRRMHGFAVQRI